jgi:hypothetical protein
VIFCPSIAENAGLILDLELKPSHVASLEKLLKIITPPNITSSLSLQLLLVFDEAHDLSNVTHPNPGFTSLSELRRALRQMIKQPVFTLFLSTTGNLFQFTPPSYLDSSNRVQTGTLDLVSPFTEADFDILYDPVGDGEITIEQAASTERIAKLGRPLYVQMLIWSSNACLITLWQLWFPL